MARVKLPPYKNFQTSSWAYSASYSVVLGVLSLRIKHSGHEADNLPPFSAKLTNEWHYTSNPSICLSGVQVLFLYFFD